MKKIATCVFVVLFGMCLFASVSFDTIRNIFKDVELTYITLSPLYKEPIADDWSFNFSAQSLSCISGGVNSVLVQTKYEEGRENCYLNFDKVNGEYIETYVHEMAHFSDSYAKSFIQLKPGISLGFLKLGFGDFTIEGNIRLGGNAVIENANVCDVFGFDGMYGYGVNFAYKNRICMHAGLHHFSGHIGDEVQLRVLESSDEKDRSYMDRMQLSETEGGYINKFFEYVRQDSFILAVSWQPNNFLRIYSQADINLSDMNTIRPWILVPNGIMSTEEPGSSLIERIGTAEDDIDSNASERAYKYSDNYKGFIFNFGIEFSKKLSNIGTLSLAYNCRINQEGQTYYQYNTYKDSNPWYFDHTVVASFAIKDSPLCLEAKYHNGQFPLLNFVHVRDSYFSLGASIHW